MTDTEAMCSHCLTWYLRGVQKGTNEGYRTGRQHLGEEQRQQQIRLHQRLGISDLITGHIKYSNEVPEQRREEIAGRGPAQMRIAA